MDRQYNDQKKHGQTIQRPKENNVHVSFGRCIASPCFFWSLYCLSMFLFVVVLPVHVSFDNDQKKHGQTIQRLKEIWTDNTTTKRNMDRQYNGQKKHEQAIQLPKETWTDNTTTKRNICLSMFLLVVVLPGHVSFGRCIACPCFFWLLYCLSMFLLVVVLSVHVSFGRCIVCPCFFWSLYCLSMDRQYNDQRKHGQTIQRPKETWTDNTTTKRNMDRQYNDQKKHGQAIQKPTETWTGLSMFLLGVILPVHVSFGRCIVCPCFFW
jgi:hypothetical protein